MTNDAATDTSSQQDEVAGNDNKNTQYHHIDLPGQPVQLGGADDHTILLRKHRDVVCDFKVGDGATYTVESPDDWFFDARTRKRTQKAIFTDGERFHAWLARDFEGELVLRSNKGGRQRLNISELDPTDYGADPKTKPAPIILQRHNPNTEAIMLAPIVVTPDDTTNSDGNPTPSNGGCPVIAPLQSDQVGHVVEVRQTQGSEVPQQAQDAMAGNADQSTLFADSEDIIKWVVTQAAGTSAYVGQNRSWISELWNKTFRLQRIVHPHAGPKWYIIFKGNPRTRKIGRAHV